MLNEVYLVEGKKKFKYRCPKYKMGCVYDAVAVVRVLLPFLADLWSDTEMIVVIIKTDYKNPVNKE